MQKHSCEGERWLDWGLLKCIATDKKKPDVALLVCAAVCDGSGGTLVSSKIIRSDGCSNVCDVIMKSTWSAR